MNTIIPIFNTALNSINKINNEKLSEKFIKQNCSNIKDLPNWIYETMPRPEPLFTYANVERFSLDIRGSHNAFIDIHELDDLVIYVKIFIVFGILQFIKNSYYEKNIDSLMQKTCGAPDPILTLQIKPMIGKNSYVYIKDDLVIITYKQILLNTKEFQIHIYESNSFFQGFGL
tara:strand:+ start:459 stop:977 length:519 start_codon:yes stop_codon:yes gene_type:complete